jgi:hypothetical protein
VKILSQVFGVPADPEAIYLSNQIFQLLSNHLGRHSSPPVVWILTAAWVLSTGTQATAEPAANTTAVIIKMIILFMVGSS